MVYAARNAEDHIQSIVNHTRGIVFLGTPHGGSDQKRWAQRGVTFAKFFGVSVDDQILKIFDEGSSKLIEVDSAFLEQLRKRNESEDSELGKVKVACFYEELPTTIGEVRPGGCCPPNSGSLRTDTRTGCHERLCRNQRVRVPGDSRRPYQYV